MPHSPHVSLPPLFSHAAILALIPRPASASASAAAAAESYALPLCSTSSEAGSLGVLDGAEAVAMDQSDYDMALSQLEHGDSPKPSFSAAAASAATSPTTVMFNSPSGMRHACEGAQDPAGAAVAASGGSARKQAPSHVSPSSSMKSGSNASVIAQQAASPSAGVGSRNKRSSPSSSGAAAAAAGTAPAVSPDAQCPSTAATKGKPKGKRARRARGEESTNASAAAAATGTKMNASSQAKDKTKRAAAAEAASKKTARAKRQQQRKEESSPNKENRPATKSSGGGAIVEAMDEEGDEDDDAHVQTHVSDDGSSASEEEEEEEGEGGAASPSSSAAAAWIAISSSGAAAPPASPGPHSRSARAQVWGVTFTLDITLPHLSCSNSRIDYHGCVFMASKTAKISQTKRLPIFLYHVPTYIRVDWYLFTYHGYAFHDKKKPGKSTTHQMMPHFILGCLSQFPTTACLPRACILSQENRKNSTT